MISRGLGICHNKSFEEVYAEAEISKMSIPGQECPACEFARIRIATCKFSNIGKIYRITSIYLLQEIKT